ncbi:MAG: methanogen output domain 1-containing protein [Candidatus Baldrarchaeia archaeon]
MEETYRRRIRVLSALLYFYGSFLRVAIKGMKDVIGEKGATGILRFSSRKHGVDVARAIMKFTGAGTLKEVLEHSMSRLNVEPEIEELENVIRVKVKNCPFWKIKGEPLLCAITEGFLEGVGSLFNIKGIRRVQTKMAGAPECVFELIK